MEDYFWIHEIEPDGNHDYGFIIGRGTSPIVAIYDYEPFGSYDRPFHILLDEFNELLQLKDEFGGLAETALQLDETIDTTLHIIRDLINLLLEARMINEPRTKSQCDGD